MLESQVNIFLFTLNNFKEEDIIPLLMEEYNDFNYVEYILDLPFDRGFKLFKAANEKKKERIEQKNKDDLFQTWLIAIQNGCKDNFEQYLEKCKTKSQVNNMTTNDKEKEEERIFNKVNKGNHRNFKTVPLNLN